MSILKFKNANGQWEKIGGGVDLTGYATEDYVEDIISTKLSNLDSVVNVRSFGAVGNGVADDTAAIQAALDACHANGGGTVIIPAGTYLLSDAVKFYSNQHIKGEPGAVLLQKDGNTGGAWGNLMRNYYAGQGGYDATENVIIDGITFDGGTQEDVATTLLTFLHSQDIQIKNCTFQNGYSYSSQAGNGHDIEVNSSSNVTISWCKFHDNRRWGYQSEIVQVDAAASEGAYPWSPDEGERNDDGTISDSVTIRGCFCEGETRETLSLGNSFVGSHSLVTNKNIVVEHCFIRNACYAVIFHAIDGLTVRDNIIYDTAAGVMVQNANANAVAINNIFYGNTQSPYNSKVIGYGNILNGVPVEEVTPGSVHGSGIYIGSGDMPDEYDVQIDPDGEAPDLDDFMTDEEVETAIDKALEGLPDSVGGYPVVNMTEATAEILPNHFYRWGEVTSLSLTLAPEIEGVASEYLFEFSSGASAPELSLPESVKWAVEPAIESGKTYQISILGGVAVMIGA